MGGSALQMSDGLRPGSVERNGDGYEPSVGTLLSDVAPERVEWLWEGRIPKGKLTIVEGDPGTGKSAMIMDLTARVSAGRTMPDGSGGGAAAGVVILSAEDGLADTIRPRLDAAEGDPERVLALTTKYDDSVGDQLLSLPQDMQLIAQGIEEVEADLVTIDPLVGFLGSEIDSHRDQDVRRVLAALATLAQWTGAAVVAIRHLNKNVGGNALYRGGGSIGFIAAARSGLLVAKDPEDEARRVLALQKSNLARPAPSLAFSLEEAQNGAVVVNWLGESLLGAGQLLAANYGGGNHAKADEAKMFLAETLKGGPAPARQVVEEGEGAGYSKRTLERAKADLGVESIKRGNEWFWSLPDQDRQDLRRGDVGGVDDVVSSDHRLSSEPALDTPARRHLEGQDRQDRQPTRVGGLGQPAGDRERWEV
jgi:AAA domain